MRTIEQIRAHDPFIVTDKNRKCYLWVADNVIARQDGKPGEGVDVFCSDDLIHFQEPLPAWRPDPEFFCQNQYWAPELHFYEGHWYMFVTTTGEMKGSGIQTGVYPPEKIRGTMVFISISGNPEGPYKPWSNGPLTPWNMLTLDGTLYVDKMGKPWMVYCHEWLQIIDGTIEAIPLSDDLKEAIGEPTVLFHSSDASWSRGGYCESYGGIEYKKTIYVTDGPFLFTDKSGALCMLWTTSSESVYTTGIARSASGELFGPWEQSQDPLYTDDGGHAMLFDTLNGRSMMALHIAHHTRNSRLKLVPVEYTEWGLKILEE